jgi:hypothetical protein
VPTLIDRRFVKEHLQQLRSPARAFGLARFALRFAEKRDYEASRFALSSR